MFPNPYFEKLMAGKMVVWTAGKTSEEAEIEHVGPSARSPHAKGEY